MRRAIGVKSKKITLCVIEVLVGSYLAGIKNIWLAVIFTAFSGLGQ